MDFASWIALAVCLSAVSPSPTAPTLLRRTELLLPSGAPAPSSDHILIEVTIDKQGRATAPEVVESAGAEYDQAALRALLEWEFAPAQLNGAPVEVRTQLVLNVPAPPEPKPEPATPPLDAQAAEPEGDTPFRTIVRDRSIARSRGTADFQLEVGALAKVPRASSAELLKLAPGVLLTNEGGVGHPEQIFLRGFDAREGQDLELSFQGVPINEAGNLHGNGYADLHFIIPELVSALRVVEGPFDPRQGNFAVAGSADYELGLSRRGMDARISVGSFNTQRLVLLWGPEAQSEHTFAGAQLFRTSGFGANRDAQNASVMMQYHARSSEQTEWKVGGSAYTAQFHSAGILRDDDYRAGRVGFFDTYDARQGGDSLRTTLYASVRDRGSVVTQEHTAHASFRSSRLKENFTGFLHDEQLAQQNPHPQRGDLLDRDSTAFTVGLRGEGKAQGTFLGHQQSLAAGYFARLDITQGLQQRVEAAGNIPYLTDFDLQSKLADIGLYLDGQLRPLDWLTLKGGVRTELLTYNILDACAQKEVRRPSSIRPPGDESCLNQRDLGKYRERTERSATYGSALMPRGSLLLGPWAGVGLSAAYGVGIRSMDPQFVTENLQTPFARIRAWEAGAQYERALPSVDMSSRISVFGTRVDRDLIFSEQEGRNLIGGSTSRLGAVWAGRARGHFFDVALNVTRVQSKFDDTDLLVPYVPDWVVRLDSALFHSLPWRVAGAPLNGSLAMGMSFVGRRPLPQSERSDALWVVDGAAELSWRLVTLGLSVTNLFDRRYRLSEFNYASSFGAPSQLPTLVPTRHFTAGPPRAFTVTLGIHLGGNP